MPRWGSFIEDVPLVEFMYLIFTNMPGESYCGRLRSLLLYLCYIFALRSFIIQPPSTFQNFFTFTFLPDSSALLQEHECSEYHPSEQSPVVSAFSYQAPVIWNQLPVSVRHSTSVSSFTSSLKTFLFLKTFSSVTLP